jgi:hypothetical protein
MKSGMVVDSATLQAVCLTPTIPDPAGKIAGKAAKLTNDVSANCGTVSIATRFPGDCSGSGSAAALGTCIERLVECDVCEAINDADGTNRDCDLFDDGVANGSCMGMQH